MPNAKRQGNRPDRRILSDDATSIADRQALAGRITYAGSAIHKLRPGDYGFTPPMNPRPSKSACDDLRSILGAEASDLFRRGIQKGMFSDLKPHGIPKYVWTVDADGEVYEAKTRPETESVYHGYRLSDDDRRQRDYVRSEWNRRC